MCIWMNFMSYPILTEHELIYSVKYFLNTSYVSVMVLGAKIAMNKAQSLLKNVWSNNHINYIDDHVTNRESCIRKQR